jgi:hypothetical protein
MPEFQRFPDNYGDHSGLHFTRTSSDSLSSHATTERSCNSTDISHGGDCLMGEERRISNHTDRPKPPVNEPDKEVDPNLVGLSLQLFPF